ATQAVWSIMAEQRGGVGWLAFPASEPAPSTETQAQHSSTYDDLWATALAGLKPPPTPLDYATWLSETQVVDIIDDSVFIGTPNVFVRDEIATNYQPRLAAALGALLERSVTLEIVITTPALA